MVPSNLYLMDNFNNRICTINFEGSWLAGINSVDLDYSKTDGTEVTSSCELKFYKYNIEINFEPLKTFFP
jgi:hypothetical protein